MAGYRETRIAFQLQEIQMKIDAQKYDHIARGVFAPVYPVIAHQILSRTCVTQGVCLDIGCGGGYLGAALARTTDLFLHFFDSSEEMLAIANRTIREIKETIAHEMTTRNQGNDEFSAKMRKNLGMETRARFEAALETAGIDDFFILHNEDIGLWFVIRKTLRDNA
jgi:SAM-dependent methyltransferase